MSAQETARIKSFMENIRNAGERQAHILEAVAGVALVRNPGGKFTKKKCSTCGQEGHRRKLSVQKINRSGERGRLTQFETVLKSPRNCAWSSNVNRPRVK